MFGPFYDLVWFFFPADLLVGWEALGEMTSEKKIGIVGAGLIGKSWALIFAAKGYPVSSKIVVEMGMSPAIQIFQRNELFIHIPGVFVRRWSKSSEPCPRSHCCWGQRSQRGRTPSRKRSGWGANPAYSCGDRSRRLYQGTHEWRVRVNYCCSGWVSHLWFGFEFGKLPLKIPAFFNFFPFGSKKISLGWVKKYPGQRRVGLLFAVGQKYPRVGSGPISSMYARNIYSSCAPFGMKDKFYQQRNSPSLC